MLLEDLNKLLVHLGVRKTAEVLVGLIGVIGLQTLAIEASK